MRRPPRHDRARAGGPCRWRPLALVLVGAGCFRDEGAHATSTSGSGGTTGPVDLPPAACGDGVVEGSEQCDEGPDNGGTGCRVDCTLHACGDGIVAPELEACDLGAFNGRRGAECTSQCAANTCGDGHVGPGEACDAADDPACGPDCLYVGCGDGMLDESGECEDGNDVDTDDCTSLCTLARCGDGFVHAGSEECDDGNVDPRDACTDSCREARCGDGVVQAGVEQCDDANVSGGDQCSPACTLDKLFVFVSSVRYTGALGGLAGADAKCQKLAEVAGVQGVYRAWLSDGEQTPMARFKHGLPYIRLDKLPIADDLAALQLPPALLGPITLTENAVPITQATDCDDPQDKVWTNLRRSGEPLGTLACAGWTKTEGVAPAGGGIGVAHAIDGAWSDSACAFPCDTPLRLYCFQQMP